MNYEKIDADLSSWASQRGYKVQTSYRDEPVRSIEIRSLDHQQKSQIGITDLTDTEIEITVFDGKTRREKIRGPLDELSPLLDAAEKLAKDWLGLI